MSTQTGPEPGSPPTDWDDFALALLGGIAAFGALVMHVAAVQTPGLSPPTGAIPLFVFNTTAATIGLLLVWRDSPARYAAAAATGLLVVVSIALIGGGFVGDLKPGTNPLGPLSYAALGVVLLVTTALAWRRRSAAGTSTGRSNQLAE